MKKKNNLKKYSIIIGILLLLSVIAYFGVQQSVLSLSKIHVEGGNVYWEYFGSANNAGETYTWNKLPDTYTLDNGTKVTPTDAVSITVNPEQPQCKYGLEEHVKSFGLFNLFKAHYFELTNPEKIINVKFTNREGITKILDGTINDMVTFGDEKSKLTIQTQGLLSSKMNCPEYSNIVLLKFKDGSYGFYKENKFLDYFNSQSNIGWQILDSIFKSKSNFNNKVGQDNTFTNTFKDGIIPILKNSAVIGNIDFGFPTYTIIANAEYFKSTYYTPPKDAKPKIDSIDVPDEMQESTQSSIIVHLSNNGDKGKIIIEVNSNDFNIVPSATNLILDENADIHFRIYAYDNNIGNNKEITVKVCALDEINGRVNCVTKTKYIDITKEPVDTYCGDGYCNANEDENTCSIDCNVVDGDNDDNDNKTSTTCSDCPAYAKSKLLGDIFPELKCESPELEVVGIETGVKKMGTLTCWSSFLQLFAVPLIFIFSLLFGSQYLTRFFKEKKYKWIGIVLAFIISGILTWMMYTMWKTALIVLGIYIVLIFIIKMFFPEVGAIKKAIGGNK